MRLTEKGKRIYPVPRRMSGKPNLDAENDFKCLTYNKLSELEDIEDELGIDLITLFDYKESPFAAFKIEQDKENDVIFFDGDSFYGDYSKEEFLELIKRLIEAYRETWALTKEELL